MPDNWDCTSRHSEDLGQEGNVCNGHRDKGKNRVNFVLVRELNRKKVTRTSSDLVVLFVFGYVLTLYNIGSLSSDGARWTHGLSLVMHKCRLERTRCSVESFGFCPTS